MCPGKDLDGEEGRQIKFPCEEIAKNATPVSSERENGCMISFRVFQRAKLLRSMKKKVSMRSGRNRPKDRNHNEEARDG